jgi:hypothetical protein
MLIDDDEFSLGIPTKEEMLRHHILLLESECQQLMEELSRSRSRISRLAAINTGLRIDRDQYKSQLQHKTWLLSAQYILHTNLTNLARGRGALTIDECNGTNDASYQAAVAKAESFSTCKTDPEGPAI